jgi:hypothetical protein
LFSLGLLIWKHRSFYFKQDIAVRHQIVVSLFYIRLVYSSFQLLKKYIRYYATASNGHGHGMHSPFVFDFILHVLNNEEGTSASGY